MRWEVVFDGGIVEAVQHLGTLELATYAKSTKTTPCASFEPHFRC
jgi:hypothetical protein